MLPKHFVFNAFEKYIENLWLFMIVGTVNSCCNITDFNGVTLEINLNA